MGAITVRSSGSDKGKKEKIHIGAGSQRTDPTTSWIDDPSLLVATARRLQHEHSYRNGENRRYQRLYYQRPVVNLTASTLTDADGSEVYDILRRHGANLTAEIIDAAVALLCRKLQPKVMPIAGDASRMAACKRISRAIKGIAEAGDWHGVFTETAKSGMYNDIGFVLIDVDDATGEIGAWKLDPLYVFWPLDGTTSPRTVINVMPVPKRQLMARYPEQANDIEKLPTWRPTTVIGVDNNNASKFEVETVALVTGWATSYGPNAPGRKVVAAGDLIFSDEEYPLDTHQVIPFRWKRSATGYAGVALARHIAPYDLTNKRILNRTLSALDGSVPWLLTEEENDVEAVSDVDYQRITYPRGANPPTVVVPNPVSTQALDRMEKNREAAFKEAHVNAAASEGQAPHQALRSSVAQFAWADSVQSVLQPQQEEWQNMHRQAAHVVMGLLQTNRKARVRMGDMLEEIEIPKLPRDKYEISFGLVSGLSLTVSGRLEQLAQIQAALPNKLDNEDVLRHIGLPDTEQLADRLLAPRELAEWIIEKALEEGEVITPPRMLGLDGLQSLFRIASQEYCAALKRPRNYYPRKHLEALRRVIKIAEWLQKSPLAPEPAPAPGIMAPLPEVSGAPAAGPLVSRIQMAPTAAAAAMPPPGAPPAGPPMPTP